MRGFVRPGDGGVLPVIFNDASYFTFLGTKGDFVFRISSWGGGWPPAESYRHRTESLGRVRVPSLGEQHRWDWWAQQTI